MTRKFLGLVLLALVAGFVPACSDEDHERANATGSNECCQLRHVCANCYCSNGEIDASVADRLGACQDALESRHGIGCTACQEKNCLSGC